MHFLLLNPPGKLPYSRDYFCSKVTKAGYAEHPVDLLILSGIISSAGHKVTVLDAIVQRLDFVTAKQRIDRLDIDAIVFLSGSTSWQDDFKFLREIKYSRPNLFLIGLGDIFLDQEIFINNSWLDAVLLDFTTEDILHYFSGERSNLKNILFRDKGKVVVTHRQVDITEFQIPIPRHELFLDKGYTFPFAKRLPFATILTDYGCLFNCSFCLYPCLGFKLRELDNVFDELRYIRSLGIRELFIKDQSFGANRARTIALCEGMLKIAKFSWTCFLRTDIVNLELLNTMKKAGCHTVIFGVENANEEILKKYKPGTTRKNIEEAFRLCRSLGIDTVGIFIFGFPEEDKKSCLETIDLALHLQCDFASFNLFVPKVETPIRKDLIARRLLDKNQPEVFDQSGIASVWGIDHLSREELNELRHLALRRFYLRPAYIMKRLIKSFYSLAQLQMLVKSACFILKDLTAKFSSG